MSQQALLMATIRVALGNHVATNISWGDPGIQMKAITQWPQPSGQLLIPMMGDEVSDQATQARFVMVKELTSIDRGHLSGVQEGSRQAECLAGWLAIRQFLTSQHQDQSAQIMVEAFAGNPSGDEAWMFASLLAALPPDHVLAQTKLRSDPRALCYMLGLRQMLEGCKSPEDLAELAKMIFPHKDGAASQPKPSRGKKQPIKAGMDQAGAKAPAVAGEKPPARQDQSGAQASAGADDGSQAGQDQSGAQASAGADDGSQAGQDQAGAQASAGADDGSQAGKDRAGSEASAGAGETFQTTQQIASQMEPNRQCLAATGDGAGIAQVWEFGSSLLETTTPWRAPIRSGNERLNRALERAMQGEQRAKTTLESQGQRVCPKAFAKMDATGNFDVFRKKKRKQMPSAAVSILVDASASMKKQFNVALESAMDISEALRTIRGIKVSIRRFPGWPDEILSFEEEIGKKREAIGAMTADGSDTPTASALITALNAITEQVKVDRKVIILITDGRPSREAISVADAIRLISEAEVELICLGIGRNADFVAELGVPSRRIAHADDLPEVFEDLIASGDLELI